MVVAGSDGWKVYVLMPSGIGDAEDVLDHLGWSCDKWWCHCPQALECKRLNLDTLMEKDPTFRGTLERLLERHGRVLSELYGECMCQCHLKK